MEPKAVFIIVHLGEKPIGYILNDCLRQLWDTHVGKEIEVYLYVNVPMSLCNVDPELLQRLTILTPYNTPQTPEHRKFLETTILDYHSWPGNGYWIYCSQRFLVIHDIIVARNLEHVFQIEADVLIYHPAQEILPTILKKDMRIGVTLFCPDMVVPGFIYMKDRDASLSIAEYFVKMAPQGKNDTEVFGSMFAETRDQNGMYPFPVVPVRCHDKAPSEMLVSGQEDFGFIFDSLPIGLWIGGINPIHPGVPYAPYIMGGAGYRVDGCEITWDEKKRPYVDGVPVFNLHVHSKNLARWRSLPS